MVDYVIGLILLGLGINTGPFNPNVKGDETEASQEATIVKMSPEEAGTAGTLPGSGGSLTPHPLKNTFRLNMMQYKIASRAASGISKNSFKARAFGNGVLKMQEDFEHSVEASREAAKKEFAEHKTELKRQLKIIKDDKKQILVDRINTKCQDINSKRVEKMTAMITKLSLVLTNVSNRTEAAAQSGKDTTSVDSAIVSAQNAISSAQTMLAAQARNTCTITLTSDTTLKTDIGKTISGMQENLKAVYEQVVNARTEVSHAVRALAALLAEPLTNISNSTATTSGSARE